MSSIFEGLALAAASCARTKRSRSVVLSTFRTAPFSESAPSRVRTSRFASALGRTTSGPSEERRMPRRARAVVSPRTRRRVVTGTARCCSVEIHVCSRAKSRNRTASALGSGLSRRTLKRYFCKVSHETVPTPSASPEWRKSIHGSASSLEANTIHVTSSWMVCSWASLRNFLALVSSGARPGWLRSLRAVSRRFPSTTTYRWDNLA